MSEYNQLDCECGRTYFTKSVAAKCPKCGKTNWTATGVLAGILIGILIAIFIGMMVGPAIYAWYAKKELGRQHSLYAAISGAVMAIIWIYFITDSDGSETMGYIGMLLNIGAAAFGMIHYRKGG